MMIKIYIFGKQLNHYYNDEITIQSLKVATARDCFSALPEKYEKIKADILNNSNSTGWSLLLNGELLDPLRDLDRPVKSGHKIYCFSHLDVEEAADQNMDDSKETASPGKRFRSLLLSEEIVVAPGVYNAITALLAEQQGFQCLHTGGHGISATLLGLPDLDFITRTEILNIVKHITCAVKVPVIADADTGYGNEKNVWHTVKEFERAGVAGIHLEDQQFPKRCGFMEGKEVLETQDMFKKIRAARRAADDPDFYIIARTDALAPFGFDEVVTRAKYYMEAGADMIFVNALENQEQFENLPHLVQAPFLVNMAETDKGPAYTAKELGLMGYKMVIYPLSALLVTLTSVEAVFKELAQTGTTRHLADKMFGFAKLQQLLKKNRNIIKDGER